MRFCARMARSPEAIWAMKRRATRLLHASNATDELGHVSPGTVLEDEEYAALFLDDVVQLYDVVVAAAPQHADLGLERLAQLAVELFQRSFTAHLGTRVVTCRARHTTANEPRPICFSTSHCPMTRGVETVAAGDASGAAGEAAASASMLATQRRFSRELTCLARRLSRAGGRRARVGAVAKGHAREVSFEDETDVR